MEGVNNRSPKYPGLDFVDSQDPGDSFFGPNKPPMQRQITILQKHGQIMLPSMVKQHTLTKKN
jgi:hypothetical protein